MLNLFQLENPQDRVGDISELLEGLCVVFNRFFQYLFMYVKYFLGIGLILIGIMTLLKFRGLYRVSRVKFALMKEETAEIKDGLKGPRFVVGLFYIIIGFGLIFNYLIYFLYIILEPLPDRLIFLFINFSGNLNPQLMICLQDVSAIRSPIELTILYCIALGSFFGLFQSFILLYLFVNETKKPQELLPWLLEYIGCCILFGFNTCLPFLL